MSAVYSFTVALLRPLTLVHLAIAVTLVLLWWKKPVKRRYLAVLTGLFVLLTLSCLPVTSYYALGSLEWAYPSPKKRPADAPVIVVLSGSLRTDGSDGSRIVLATDTLYRCLLAAELYHTAPCPVLVSGGKVLDTDPDPPLAVAMRDFLLTQGVRSEDLLVESASHTTYENAVESARLLREKGIHRIVLVTDAAHMRRAVGCFRKQGLDVVPCGSRYRALGRNEGLIDYLPNASAAAGVEEAAHEWLGLAWYWFTGKL